MRFYALIIAQFPHRESLAMKSSIGMIEFPSSSCCKPHIVVVSRHCRHTQTISQQKSISRFHSDVVFMSITQLRMLLQHKFNSFDVNDDVTHSEQQQQQREIAQPKGNFNAASSCYGELWEAIKHEYQLLHNRKRT